MKDIHYHTVHDQINPLIRTLGAHPTGYISVRIRPESTSNALAGMEQTITSLMSFPTEM